MTENDVIRKISDDIDKTRAAINDLQRDGEKVSYIMDKLDVAVERLTQVAADFSKLIAVHESRIVHQELLSTDIVNRLEQRRIEVDSKLDQLAARIIIENDNLKKHIDNLIEKQSGKIKDVEKQTSEQFVEVNKQLATHEKIIWISSGVAIVVGFILSQTGNILKLFN